MSAGIVHGIVQKVQKNSSMHGTLYTGLEAQADGAVHQHGRSATSS